MARLRAPGGCPWDREQNFDTIKPYLLEETYEVFDAIDQRDWPGLAEELGDLMLQAVFFAQMASEEGKFRIDDSLDAISEKLIRRHPHVFGDGAAKTSDDVKRRWDEIKADEKKEQGQASAGPSGFGVRAIFPRWWKRSRSAPKPRRSASIGRMPARCSTNWMKSFESSRRRATNGTPAEIEGEIGDLLFVLVNLARNLKVDPEQALRKTNAKFRKRFALSREARAACRARRWTRWRRSGRRPRRTNGADKQ